MFDDLSRWFTVRFWGVEHATSHTPSRPQAETAHAQVFDCFGAQGDTASLIGIVLPGQLTATSPDLTPNSGLHIEYQNGLNFGIEINPN